MRGYHNEVTAKALTGDGFRRDRDGFSYFVGRGDDMFVSGGEKRHPDIHQAVVVPVDDELKFKKPVGFVLARPGAAPSEAAVKAFARSNAGVVSAGNAARGHKQNRPAHPGTSCRRIGPTIGMPCCTLRARLFPPECHDQHVAISRKPRIDRGYRSNAVIDPAVVDQG
jgi:hypothetical protein